MSTPLPDQTILLDKSGAIARITFNRPARMNTLDQATAQAFAEAVADAVNDTAIRVIILSGTGRAFMAGGDLAAMQSGGDPQTALRGIVDPVHAAMKLLATAPQIVIAAIHGPVAGAGMSIALAADLCIAGESTVMTYAYSKIGGVADCGITWTLPRIVGHRRALEIALFSPAIPAAEAKELGLINRIVPDDGLHDEVDAVARQILAGPPEAFAAIKRLMQQSSQQDFTQMLDAEGDAFVAAAGLPYFSAALEAFFAKSRAKAK